MGPGWECGGVKDGILLIYIGGPPSGLHRDKKDLELVELCRERE